MATSPWVFGWDQLIGIANAGAVCFAAFIAYRGVDKWKEERVQIRQFELAEEALALMYRAQEVFDYIRNPGSFSPEGNTRPRGENEPEEVTKDLDSKFIPIERINSEQEYFKKVIDIRPGIKAIFGEDKSEPLDKILELRGNIIVAARIEVPLIS